MLYGRVVVVVALRRMESVPVGPDALVAEPAGLMVRVAPLLEAVAAPAPALATAMPDMELPLLGDATLPGSRSVARRSAMRRTSWRRKSSAVVRMPCGKSRR